jgi:hypothetical protein
MSSPPPLSTNWEEFLVVLEIGLEIYVHVVSIGDSIESLGDSSLFSSLVALIF